MKSIQHRWRFAGRWALRHMVLSVVIALISAALVFGLWYPMPYRAMLGVGGIYVLILIVDVVCGPLITFVLASPRKSRREMFLDLSLVGMIQMAALLYGMQAVWIGRPAVLAFEKDRLTVVSSNEIDHADLHKAPPSLQTLSSTGLLKVGTRMPRDNNEFVDSVELSLAGFSPAMRPGWWEPIGLYHDAMRAHAKPLTELIDRRPNDALMLEKAAAETGQPVGALTYLPLTSSKTKDWIALLDTTMQVVGYAPVDGF